MLQVDTQSNRFIATIGTGVALLLALNMGIVLHSHFLKPPYSATETITYFLAFSGAIIMTTYKTVNALDNPHPKYIEGLVLGVGGGTAVLLYLPSILFKPMTTMFPSVMPFFIVSYLISIGVTVLLVVGTVKGSESYANQTSRETNESEEEQLDEEQEDTNREDNDISK